MSRLEITPMPSEFRVADKRMAELDPDLPKLPTTCVVLGRVGSGKSSCLYSLMTKGYVYYGKGRDGKPGKKAKSVFDEVVCFVGNGEADEGFRQIPCKNLVICHSFDSESFDSYLDELKKHQLERLEKKKPCMNVAILFDDMAATQLLKKVNGASPLERLVLTSRHEANATIFFLSQIYKGSGFATPIIRNNTRTWIIYNMSAPEVEKIAEEHSNHLTPDGFTQVYEEMMKRKYNFMTIDYGRPLDARIWERFEGPV